MWITCGQRAHRAIPAARSVKLPNSDEESQFSGILYLGWAGSTGAPGRFGDTAIGGNPPLFSCWRRPGSQVWCCNLEKQVEREGSMDWIGLLIPLKLVVFCVILVVIYRMMSGWNSIQTPEAPELPAACCGLHGPAAGEPGKRLPSTEVIHDKLN